ncbi:MAG: tetratricopeptide repeat protein [Anaerolineales bacterium]
MEKAGENEEALAYFSQAAEMAASKYAIDEAAEFYVRALALIPNNDPEKRYPLLMGQEKMFRLQGDRDGQRKVLNKLEVIVDTLADQQKQAELLIRKAWLEFWTSEFREGLTYANEAVMLAEKIGDPKLSRQAYYVRAWMLMLLDNTDSAIEQAEAALSLARNAGDRYAVGNTLNILGLIKNSQEDFYTAHNYLEEFLAIARELGDKEREITALNNLGVALTRLGDFQAAQDTYLQILKIAQETGYQSSKSTSYINLGWLTSAWGNWEAARQYCETGIKLKKEQEQVDAVAEGLLWLGNTFLGLNQPGNAVAAYKESQEIRLDLDQPHYIVEIQAGLARVALAQDDLTTAQYYSREILKYLSEQGSFRGAWEPLRIYLTCYRVLHSAEDPQAENILMTAYDFLQQQAARIPEETYRYKFLNDIPWHREIVQAWEAR